MSSLTVSHSFQCRLEHFGSLLRNKKTGQIYQLGKVNTLILLMYQVPRHKNILHSDYKSFSKDLDVSYSQFNKSVEDLLSQGLIVHTDKQPVSLFEDIFEIKRHFEVSTPKKI